MCLVKESVCEKSGRSMDTGTDPELFKSLVQLGLAKMLAGNSTLTRICELELQLSASSHMN